MKLIDGIQITKTSRIAFVGAGGKSTSMFRLARQWGEKCIVSTSTHLADSQAKQADAHFVIQTISDLKQLDENLPNGVTLLSGPFLGNQRVGGLSDELFEEVCNLANKHSVPVLIEADGSRRLPFKAPAQHEPAIPPCVDTVVVLAGLSGLGKKLDKYTVHRPELFSQLSGLSIGETIKIEHLETVLGHLNGGLKNIMEGMKKILFLNQADNVNLQAQASKISKTLLKEYHCVVVGSLENRNNEVIARHKRIAGIVLAAGSSERLGRPKQLLEWEGESFIRVVTKNAIDAGLDPVVVVTGAAGKLVSKGVKDLPVEVVENNRWQEGQSSSIKEGLKNLPNDVGGVIFLLVDQPQIPPSLIVKIVETYSENEEPIVATMVDGRRGNPVLFDKSTFYDLSKISGDKGGRQIFSKYKVFYLPWLDPIVGLDVDNEDDYFQLLNYKNK